MWVGLDGIPPFINQEPITSTITVPSHNMHTSAFTDPPFSLRPAKILENADKFMEQARALYDNYEQIINPIDRTLAQDKMTL